MAILILTEKIDAGCQIAESLYNMGVTSGDFKSTWADIKRESAKKGYLVGGNYIITWTNGHLGVDLKPSQINESYQLKFRFDINFNYNMPNLLSQMQRVVKSEKEHINNTIKSLIDKNNLETIYICTDADAEGERIANDALFVFNKINKNTKVKRMWITGAFNNTKIIEEQLQNSLDYNSEKYKNLLYSQKARSNGDFISGMKATKVLVDCYSGKLYSGRVKNTIIGIIGDRELEITDFKPKDFFVINSISKIAMNHFYVKEVEDVDKNGKIITTTQRTTQYYDKREKDKVVEEMRDTNLTGEVTKFSKIVGSSNQRPLPLSGDDFKTEMADKYKLSLEDSGKILQYLRDEGFTTYQGTNGRYFSTDEVAIVETAYNTAVKFFNPKLETKLTTTATCFDNEKAKKQNHPPLHLTEKIPTDIDLQKWKNSNLNKVQEGYELIAQRVLVHFLPNDKYETIKIEVSIGGHLFDTSGVKPIIQGWREFIGEKKANTFFEADYKVGDEVKFDDLDVIAKKTTKPKFYSESDILSTLMNVSKVLNKTIDEEEDVTKKLELKKAKVILKNVEGIGTDRTRETILTELAKAELIIAVKKEFKLTETGWNLYNALPPELKSVVFTAKWEEYFEEIRRGEKSYDEIMKIIDESIQNAVNHIIVNIDKDSMKKSFDTTATNLPCPLCKGIIIEAEKVFKCQNNLFQNSKHSGCDFMIVKHQKLLETDLTTVNIEKLLAKELILCANGNSVELDLNNKFFTKINFAKNSEGANYTPKANEKGGFELVETAKTFRFGEKFLFKNVFGKDLTKTQAQKIFNGEKINLKRHSTKSGKEFEVTVWQGSENGKLESAFK